VSWCLPCAYGDIVARFPEGSMLCAHDRVGATFGFCGLLLAESAFRSLRSSPHIESQLLGVTGELETELGEAYLLGKSRQLLRKEFNIQQSKSCFESDIFVACFCASCAVCQELREIKIRERRAQKLKDDETIVTAPKAMTIDKVEV
jgi:Cys-rich protein (TIGR01571 family)